jgi:hypothetical protein
MSKALQSMGKTKEEVKLRDDFAGLALVALMGNKISDPPLLARLSYQTADAMMEERDRGNFRQADRTVVG